MDEFHSKEIADLLSDVVAVSSINIGENSDLDYGEYSVQQIRKSRLAVVFFKDASEWALPFTQQIWKMAGGASSPTPILLIGDEENEANTNKKFNAPKVFSKIVNRDLVPLEIKATYDKVCAAAV